jgi:hypothetical protein
MFKNPARVVVQSCDTIIDLLDVLRINTKSLKTLSYAGNQKADFILKAAEYDCDKQTVELDALIAKAKSKAKPKA